MTDPDASDLRDLLHDAVSDVHPEPALAEIRRRAQTSTSARRPGRWLVVPAAAAAVAVIVGGIALLNQTGPTPAQVGGPAATTSGTPSAGAVERTLAVYYVGSTSQGPRLYREFHRVGVPSTGGPVGAAVDEALRTPNDPDYRTPWPAGTHATQTGTSADGAVTVSLGNSSTDLTARPPGLSAAEASAGVQQLVYTIQAAVQNLQPVQFQIDGKDTDTLLGVGVSGPVSSVSQLDALARVSISDPAQGAVVHGSFTANGVASSFEANVPWQITKHGKVVKLGFSTAAGWMDRLYPWKTAPIDVSGLAPGRYTFVAMTDDPSSGEGPGPQSDTRTIVVRR